MLFIVLFIITFSFIFQKYSIEEFLNTLRTCNKFYIFGAFFCVALYLVFGALYLKKIFASFQIKISNFQSLCYNAIEIYFSAVTPSSTGGQPVEAYYMARDKIPYQKSTVAILINTMLYKLVIVILGLLGMIIFPNIIFQNGWLFNLLLLLGMFINIAIIILFASLIYSEKLPIKILNCGIKILSFFHLLKKDEIEKKQNNIEESMKDYRNCAEFTKSHPDVLLKSFVYLFLQRLSLFLISFFIYRAFGLNDYNLFVILFLQIAVTQATDCVPFPGGVMVGETLTYQINTLIYGNSLALSSMLLLRGISFYFLVFVSSILFVIYHFKGLRKKDNNDRNL